MNCLNNNADGVAAKMMMIARNNAMVMNWSAWTLTSLRDTAMPSYGASSAMLSSIELLVVAVGVGVSVALLRANLRARGFVPFFYLPLLASFGYALGPESDWGCPLMLRGDLK